MICLLFCKHCLHTRFGYNVFDLPQRSSRCFARDCQKDHTLFR
jgi:hypothetical protein